MPRLRILARPHVGPLARVAVALAVMTAAGALTGARAHAGADDRAAEPEVVRVATIPAATTGGLLDQLVADFEEETGLEVRVQQGNVFGRARMGEADLVIVHYGAPGLEALVTDGFGRWPQPSFANAVAFIIPPGDPARVRQARDPVQAFERIAATEASFIANDLPVIQHLTDVLWHAAGRPDHGEWFQDRGLRGQDAVDEARRQRGYTLWGLHPFLQHKQLGMQPVVFDDVLMQAVITTVVVDPARVPDVNVDGAIAFQDHLQEPATQAHIRAFRLPSMDARVFWPAAERPEGG